MAISGPVLIGSAFQRNQAANSPLSFNANQNIPVGSTLFGVWGTDAPDTADCQMSDAAGNIWSRQVQSLDPNNTGFMCNIFVCQTTAQINSGQAISMLCPVRSSYGGPVFMFSGARSSLFSSLVRWSSEWAATPLAPSGQTRVAPGMSVFASLAVAGPNNDVFTQDANFAGNVVVSATGFNVTIHGTARHNVQLGQPGVSVDPDNADLLLCTYAPTLGTARQGTLVMFGFS